MDLKRPDLPMPISGMLPADQSVSSVPDPLLARVVATSRILAAQASDDEGDPFLDIPGVGAFRQTHLPEGRVLSTDAIESWVAAQAARDGPPSLWIVGVAVQPEEVEQEPWGRLVLHIPPLPMGGPRPNTVNEVPFSPLQMGAPRPNSVKEVPSWDYRWLEYSTPTLPNARQRVRAGAVLDQLRRLALLLSDDKRWDRAQATTFVLTGLIPYAGPFVQWLEEKRGRRPRGMTYKHLELAVFTQLHEGETLAGRMAQWNAAHPEWAYRTVEHFGGDSRLAVRRLVEERTITNGND